MKFTRVMLWLGLLIATPGFFYTATANPVISEVFYDKIDDSRQNEFIELWNTSPSAIALGGFFIDEGVSYTFPAEATIGANGRVVITQNKDAFLTNFVVNASDVYQWDAGGLLANGGERIRLRRVDGGIADRVDYGVGGEWPVMDTYLEVEATDGYSLQLIHQGLDGNQAGAWRAAAPTPLQPNSEVAVSSEDDVILYDKVKHSPKAPTSADTVTITIQVPGPKDGMSAALDLQRVDPGNYIALADTAYNNWSTIPMYPATNDIWEATVPASFIAHRTLVRYRVRLNAPGFSITLPSQNATTPNFGFFTFDGISNYGATDLSQLEQVPVYQLLAKATNIAEYVFTTDTKDFPVTGTLFFDGEVYDHVRYRAKGRRERHSRVKRNIRIKLNKGHKVEHFNDHGIKLSRKKNLVIYGGSLTGLEGEVAAGRQDSGLSEGVALKHFNLFGAPASAADWMHFRVIDSAAENPADPREGDFWGLFNILGDYDADWLQDQGLERSYVYEYKTDEVSVFPSAGPFGFFNDVYNEINQHMPTNNQKAPAGVPWRDFTDLDTQYRFMAANEGIAQNENAYWSKHYHKMYYNPTKGWHLMPADFDGTMRLEDVNTPSEAICRDSFWADDDLRVEWQGVLREYVDLLLNNEGIDTLIEEKASHVHTPNAAVSLAHLDRDRWSLNYTSFDAEKTYLKTFFSQRRTFILSQYLNDNTIPSKPGISLAGPSGFPADNIRFRSTEFASPTNHNPTSIEWLVAEITDPANPPPLGEPWHYEADPTWRFSRNNYGGGTPVRAIPQGVVRPGHTYRARVRHRDNSGRWSHWSDPLEFTATDADSTPGAALVINEIHYNPLAGPGLDDGELEFIEIRNPTGSAIDIGGYTFDGVGFTFPIGSTIPANGYLAIAGDADEFNYRHGFEPAGHFSGSLSNGGERLRLIDAWDQIIDEVDYEDGATWGPGADGFGPSLELIDASSDNNNGDAWLSIGPVDGTPGAPNTVECNSAANRPDIHFNEINYDSSAAADSGDWIELRNNAPGTVNLANWIVSDGANSYTLPSVSIAAGETVVLVENLFEFQSIHPGVPHQGPLGFSLSNGGESLILLNNYGCLIDLIEYDDDIPWELAADGNGSTIALSSPDVDRDAPWSWLASPNGGTPGQNNGFGNPCSPAPGAIVINEINVDSTPFADPGDWIELYNAGDAFVNLTGWRLYDDTGRFTIDNPTFLMPGEYLIIAEKPFDFNGVFPGISAYSAQSFTLRSKGERLILTTALGCPVVDFTYDNNEPWPLGLGTGGTLALANPNADPSDPANWVLGDGLGTPKAANNTDPCAAPFWTPSAVPRIQIHDVSDGSDWFELRNTTGADLDLGNWRFTDGSMESLFPSNTIVGAGGIVRFADFPIDSGDTLSLFNERRCLEDLATATGNAVNHAPQLNAPGVLSFTENRGNTATFTAFDRDNGQSLLFSSPDLPANAELNSAGVLNWIPSEASGPGSVTFTLVVTDTFIPTASAQTTVTINIAEANRPPTIADAPASIAEEIAWTRDLNPGDPDIPAQNVTVDLLSGPPGLTMNGTTIAWTPTEAQGPGSYTADVRVSDGIDTETKTINLTVNEANAPPVLLIADDTIDEGVPWTLQLNPIDTDQPVQPLTLTLLNGPTGLTLNGNTLSWTPTENQAPGSYIISVRVSDGVVNTDTVFNLLANEANRPPVLSIADQTIAENETWSFTLNPSDPDVPAQTLTPSIVSAPAGVTISGNTISWTPTETQGPATETITLSVSDGVTATPAAFTITVAEVNRPPNLSVSPQILDEHAPWTLLLGPTDPDRPSQPITLSILSGPPGLTLNGHTLSWTPTESQGPASYTATIRVNDGVTTIDRNVRFTVREANLAPSFAQPTINPSIGERQLWTQQISAFDADSLPLAYAISGSIPPGLIFNPAERWIHWIPGADTAGTYSFTVTATDTAGASDNQTINLTVLNGPPAPGGDLCPFDETLLPRDSTWSWSTTQTGSNWLQPWFDSQAWASGPAELGFGEDSVVTTIPKGNARTVFRHTFNVANVHEIDALSLGLKRDDGAVVYLNGIEIARDNLPPGLLDQNTLAISSIFGSSETAYHPFSVPPEALAEGQNILAVAVHQSSISSVDMRFNLDLTASRLTSCSTIIIDSERFRTTGNLRFTADDGATYNLQRCDELNGGVWTTIQSLTAEGTDAEFQVAPSNPNERQFYRVIR